MRYLSVSSPGSFSVAVGASGELHGFTVQLLENSRGRLRARSATLGSATVVMLRVGELDEMLERMAEARRSGVSASTPPQPLPSPFSPQQHALMYRYPLQEATGGTAHAVEEAAAAEAAGALFVTVGSDDGYGEATLLRVAALVSELCLFLNIDPLRGGPNAPVLKQLLLYIEARLRQQDVSLLCQTVERLVRPAIIATGFASGDATGLLDDLARQLFLPAADCAVPNYIAVLLGHKLVLETTSQWNEEAARACGVERLTLHDSDRYLAYLVTCAIFAAPLQRSCHDVSRRERRLLALEERLRRFGIHRHNVGRHAARQAVQTYVAALRRERVGECSRADFFECAYNELLAQMTRRGMAGDADEAPASAPPRAVHNEYHLEDIDFALIEGRTIQLDNICFRNSDFVGSMQLRWITTGGPPQQQNHGVSADGEDPIMAACPYGYGVCLLYLPPRTAREQERWRCPSVTAGEQTLLQLSRDILGSMETSFNCFQWLLSPPVESYEIPGLIHFVAVDRRTNSGIVASFHRMMHQKPRHVQEAVASLKRLVALNISRAHTLLHAGYSEGLWGHFGMQFFYCVCAVDETAALTSPPPPSTAPASHEPPRRSFFSFGGEGLLSPPSSAPSKAAAAADAATAAAAASSSQPAEESSTSTVDTADSLFGSLDARLKLPSATLPHLVLRPMLLPDFTCNEPEGHRVVEVYAVFVGTMSPAEVCKGVEKLLRSRVLPPRGGTY